MGVCALNTAPGENQITIESCDSDWMIVPLCRETDVYNNLPEEDTLRIEALSTRTVLV